MKSFYRSKTLWVNFLVILAALLSYALSSEFPVKLSEFDLQIGMAILAAINFGLRLTTDKKLK